jgi:purine nucleosidase
VLRRVLAESQDQSVVIAQVGFSTNLARLLMSPADDLSPLPGKDLVRKKVRLLSAMAGTFAPIKGKVHLEYNIVKDIPAARDLAEQWPTPIIYSGYEIGLSIPYPAVSIEQDYRYTDHHPLAEAYHLYMPPPHNRPTWDLTSVLYAVRLERNYFGLSAPGKVTVEINGETKFHPEAHGPHRYLTATPEQKVRVEEALVQLSSQPPK